MARLSMEEVKVLELITISGQKPEFCEIIDLIQTIKHKQQKIEAQQQEINELKTMLNDAKVHNMAMENGEINMTIEGPNARNLFASIVQAFRQNGGKNFFAVDMKDRNTGESFTVIIQKNNGITPTQRMNIQEEQIKALTADKDELAGRLMQYDSALKKLRKDLHNFGHIESCSCEQCKCVRMAIEAIDTLLGGVEDV
jgi:predicted RNase H-like nuclease (RuvC/YqgF family)